jgi:UDPglucose--hexose-1-phosphate uridylyltransferase
MPNHLRRSPDYQPELRKNVITREWVIIAKGRGKRPSDFTKANAEAAAVPIHDPNCPFCPGGEATTPPEVYALRPGGGRNTGGWQVRVVPNKFAALHLVGSDQLDHDGIYVARDGVGAHEVVIETPEHNLDLWEMGESHVSDVLEAFRQRYIAYESTESLPYVLIFRNHGPQAGTSLVHPHSQLIAAPVIPQQLDIEMQGAAAYWEYLGRCVYCAIIEQEIASGERTVLETDHFLVVTAFAGRYPYELWVIPKRHTIRFADISEDEVTDLARVLTVTLGKLAGCLGRPSYNFAIHSAPAAEHNTRAYHWHLEIFPRFTTLGGFELGSAIYINVAEPEEAAGFLREAEVPAPVAAG